jgi:hypothetical protein
MDIFNFANHACDFCDYENKKPCITCMKILIYTGIKDGIKESFENQLDFSEIGDKFDNLSENLDCLYTEIYKYRKDMASKDPNDTRIFID